MARGRIRACTGFARYPAELPTRLEYAAPNQSIHGFRVEACPHSSIGPLQIRAIRPGNSCSTVMFNPGEL